jgi:hypothetical protein
MTPGETGKKLLRTLPDAFPTQVAVDDYRVIGSSRLYHFRYSCSWFVSLLPRLLEGRPIHFIKKEPINGSFYVSCSSATSA